jgi:hypothetical protein
VLLRAFDAMAGGTFVVFVWSRRNMPQKDDVQSVRREMMRLGREKGALRSAVLVDSALSQMQIRRLFEEAGVPLDILRFFTDETEARTWLAEVEPRAKIRDR